MNCLNSKGSPENLNNSERRKNQSSYFTVKRYNKEIKAIFGAWDGPGCRPAHPENNVALCLRTNSRIDLK